MDMFSIVDYEISTKFFTPTAILVDSANLSTMWDKLHDCIFEIKRLNI